MTDKSEHHDSHRQYIEGYNKWMSSQTQEDDESIEDLWAAAGYGEEYRKLLEASSEEGFQHDLPPLEDPLIPEQPNVQIKCECGSDKANLPYHSEWCPKNTGDL